MRDISINKSLQKELYNKIYKIATKKLKIPKNLAKTAKIDTIRGFLSGKAIQWILNNKNTFQKIECKNLQITFKVTGSGAVLKVICKRNESGFYCEILGLEQYDKTRSKSANDAIKALFNKINITSLDTCIDTKERLLPQGLELQKNIKNQSFYYKPVEGTSKVISYDKEAKERGKRWKRVTNKYRLETSINIKKGLKTLKRNKKLKFKTSKKQRISEGSRFLISLIDNKGGGVQKKGGSKICKKNFSLKKILKKIKNINWNNRRGGASRISIPYFNIVKSGGLCKNKLKT